MLAMIADGYRLDLDPRHQLPSTVCKRPQNHAALKTGRRGFGGVLQDVLARLQCVHEQHQEHRGQDRLRAAVRALCVRSSEVWFYVIGSSAALVRCSRLTGLGEITPSSSELVRSITPL